MKRGIVLSAGVVALVVALGPTSVASSAQRAQSAQKAKISGPEKLFVLPRDTTSGAHPGTVLLTGAVADYGKSVATNAGGKPTPQGTYRELELTKGTFLVDIASLEQAIDTTFSHAAFNMTTCSVSITVSGAIKIVSGTKAYSGITGSLMLTGSIAEIAPRTKSGACTTKTSTRPVATFTEFTGSGTVSLP